MAQQDNLELSLKILTAYETGRTVSEICADFDLQEKDIQTHFTNAIKLRLEAAARHQFSTFKMLADRAHEMHKTNRKNAINSIISFFSGMTRLTDYSSAEKVEAIALNDKDFNKNRGIYFLHLYTFGYTLEDLGRKYKLTRERIKQIMYSRLATRLKESFGTDLALDHFWDKYKNINKTNRFTLINKVSPNALLIEAKKYASLSKFTQKTGISSIKLSKFLPEALKIIELNQRKRLHRWSIKYTKCKNCGTTMIPHIARGFCANCYPKSDYFKKSQKRSFHNHLAKRRAQVKEYMQIYKKRPEVIEKMKHLNDIQNFAGNREHAITRDNFKCTTCGLSRSESYDKFHRDLFVKHLTNSGSNDLSNLRTLCWACFQRSNKDKI